MKLFIVGRYHESLSTSYAWEIMGIWEDEDEARRNCLTKNDFVGPIETNKYLGEKIKPWPGCYYPLNVLNVEEVGRCHVEPGKPWPRE